MLERLKNWVHKFTHLYEYEGVADCGDTWCVFEYRCKICGGTKFDMYDGGHK